MFDVITQELEASGPGAFAVIDRILEVMLIEAFRNSIRTRSLRTASWLTALQDPRLGRVLSDIHFSPEKNWTVAKLAATAGMSRSSFAALFHTATGRTPMEHLARWRMHELPISSPTGQNRSVSEVVEQVGTQIEQQAAPGVIG